MVLILHVRAPANAAFENQITDMRWYNPQTGEMNVANLSAMVHFIVNEGGIVAATNGQMVFSVNVSPGFAGGVAAPFLTSTIPGGLLSLPRF